MLVLDGLLEKLSKQLFQLIVSDLIFLDHSLNPTIQMTSTRPTKNLFNKPVSLVVQ